MLLNNLYTRTDDGLLFLQRNIFVHICNVNKLAFIFILTVVHLGELLRKAILKFQLGQFTCHHYLPSSFLFLLFPLFFPLLFLPYQQCLYIIGASVSKPHTSDFYCNFSYIIYILLLFSVVHHSVHS